MDFWNRASDYSQESSAGWVQEGPLREVAPLRKARNGAQWIAWCCINDYWLNLCQSIQLSVVHGNIHAMYDGMKKAFGPSTTKIPSLKSTTSDTITDQGKEMERWAEHYQELYSRENTVTDSAVESTCTLPILEELDVPPSVEELSKAIDSLGWSKAPGKDGVLPKVIKAGK